MNHFKESAFQSDMPKDVKEQVSPLISIVLATYNGEVFLTQQLDSLFSQTYLNIEIIAIDDGSSDNTVKILREYAARHVNMKVFLNEKNLGLHKNFRQRLQPCFRRFYRTMRPG